MSRIGRMPITVPADVTVTVAENNVVTVKGKLGTLTQQFSTRMNQGFSTNLLHARKGF